METQKDFSVQKCINSQPEKSLSGDDWCPTKHGVTEIHDCHTDSLFLRLASGRLNIITGHLIGLKNSDNFAGTERFRGGKESFGFKKLLDFVNVSHRSRK